MKTILKELWGLFVDDGNLALGLVIWVAVCAAALPVLPIADVAAAPVLFLGSLAILIVNVLRTARRKRIARSGG